MTFLIREYFNLESCKDGICQDLLTEDEKYRVKNEGSLFLVGKLQEANIKNGNGRVYPKEILEREINNYQILVRERRALGELDHPDDSVINLDNVSHVITKIWWEGNKVMGKLEILRKTNKGKQLAGLIESGIKLGISSRGLGSVHESLGNIIVEDDYQLICFDMVAEPSTPNSFMLKENFTRDKRKIFGKEYYIKQMIKDILG